MINIKSVKKGDLSNLIEINKDVFDYSASIEDFENYFNEDTIKIWKISTRKIIGYVIPFDVEKRKKIADDARKNWWNIFHTNINDVREFYGEYNAYYFAWLQHLTRWLFYLSIFGLISTIFQFLSYRYHL